MAEPKVFHSKPCPICSTPSVEAYRPFCSKRCQLVDLNRWFNGGYAIPAVETDEPEGDEFE